ncbi:unnamed protein product [Periconia digitata]|uniref:Uncharacterized protein n=1 Tax=Periconia digitata TaxID=1303443 RepID=A0A9W4UXE7_9PLEO|nr:unnamed protein product [Periconia digitata]
MHKAKVRVVVFLCEDNLSFQLLNTPMFNRIWIRNDIRSATDLNCRICCAQFLEYLSYLLLEGGLLRLRNVLPGYVEADSRDSLLYKHISSVDLSMTTLVLYQIDIY